MPPTASLPRIGVCGRKRTGKDTFADYVIDAYGYRRLGFADPLREMADRLNPLVGEDEFGPLRYSEALAAYGYEVAKDLFPEVRRVLQVLGTEAVRGVLGEDVWVDHLAKRVEAAPASEPLVITDVRFPNEANRLRSLGFVVIRLTRPGQDDADAHPSETALDHYSADTAYDNAGSLEALYAFAEWVVAGRPLGGPLS